jgi:uncharacterized membrane protein
MPALARIPATQGIAAMQSINVTVINPLFMLAFLGTGIASVVLGVIAVTRWDEEYAPYLLIGGVVYILGEIVTTFVVHQPHNLALVAMDPSDAATEAYWSRYVPLWTAWNHFRTIAALATTVLLVIAIRVS